MTEWLVGARKDIFQNGNVNENGSVLGTEIDRVAVQKALMTFLALRGKKDFSFYFAQQTLKPGGAIENSTLVPKREANVNVRFGRRR